MELIDKTAIVAEINRQHKILMQTEHTYGAQFILGFRQACRQIIDFLDTLEVKEVDLDREIRRYRMRNPIIQHREESLYDYMASVAKHFFELGLKVNQKGE